MTGEGNIGNWIRRLGANEVPARLDTGLTSFAKKVPRDPFAWRGVVKSAIFWWPVSSRPAHPLG